jgi:cytochrome b subunit of formate dehydrogenase
VAVVSTWSLLFAAPHLYWALGGRAGLAGEAAAADVAFEQSWFAAYNLAAGCLAISGAMVAAVLTMGWGSRRVRRCLLIATAAACVVLLVRGLLGLTLLAASLVQGTLDERTPPILLAIEPWFVLGGLAYGGLTLHHRLV